MEPVLLPDLGHTGVERETLPGDRPLFYPNGYKKCGLGAKVRKALYESASAPRLSKKTLNGQQQPPSDWAGSSAYYSLSDCSSSKRTEGSEAIPAGQGGRFPTDVWGTPRTVGATGSFQQGSWMTMPPSGIVERISAKRGRSGASKARRKLTGGFARKNPSVNQISPQLQQQQREKQGLQSSSSFFCSTGNLPPKDFKASTYATTSRASLASSWIGSTGFDASGRDSEWLAERRAANQEAREVLGALKRNSTRLCFLVGDHI